MLIYSIVFSLGMVYNTRTFHFKKQKKFISFKQYFKLFKFQTTFSYCQMILIGNFITISRKRQQKVQCSL